MDIIFTARQLQGKCIEQQMPLYKVFVDLTKAFDTVNREALGVILGRIGCPSFVKMFQELHENMKACVAFNGQLSGEFAVNNGVKQGDIPAPTLFSIYFPMLLAYAFKDCDKGAFLRFRTTDKVFNLRRFNTKSQMFGGLVRELLYADDANFVPHSERDMQDIMNCFSTACDAFGLTIRKTKVMFTPAPGAPYIEPNIYVRERRLDVVDTFVYLGSTVSRDGSLDAEICLRIQRASTAFGAQETRLWCDRGISVKTKISVYSTCVLSVLLYSSECWTTQHRHQRQLERFHQKCLRRVLHVKWQSITPDTDILKKAECLSIEAMVIRIGLCWAGHVVRMEDVRLPKQLFYGELKTGKHPQYGPKRRFKDCLKDDLKAFKIPVQNWKTLAKCRTEWSRLVRGEYDFFERERIDHAEHERNLWNLRQCVSFTKCVEQLEG